MSKIKHAAGEIFVAPPPVVLAKLAEQARDRALAAGKSVEIVIYPDAPHGFHADYRPSYRREAAEDGWTRALAFLKSHGVG